MCNKIGSMLQLEATLYSRYQRADAPCSTYTNDIDKFQHPPVGDGPWNAKDYPALPFYKHKNDNGFRDAYARSGKGSVYRLRLEGMVNTGSKARSPPEM